MTSVVAFAREKFFANRIHMRAHTLGPLPQCRPPLLPLELPAEWLSATTDLSGGQPLTCMAQERLSASEPHLTGLS